MSNKNRLTLVADEFARELKIQAARQGKTVTKFTEELGDSGFEIVRKNDKRKEERFRFGF
jgi:hypothetical protein